MTDRELEILGYVAAGHTNKYIAWALNISHQTVKNHMTSIMDQLCVLSRTGAAIVALKIGLLDLTEIQVAHSWDEEGQYDYS